MILQHLDVRMLRHGVQQRALDLASRHVARVEHASLRVPALAAQAELARAIIRVALVKMHAQLDQLPDARRPLGHDLPHHLLVAQPRAGCERVLDVQGKTSSPLVTHAMPPWAHAVFVSARPRFVMIATVPSAAAFFAKLNPAMPLPMMTKS